MTEAKLDDKQWVVSILMHTMRYFEPIAAGIYQVSLTFLSFCKEYCFSYTWNVLHFVVTVSLVNYQLYSS